MTDIEKNLPIKNKSNFFWKKISIYSSLGFHEGRPSYKKGLQPSKENIQHFKTRISPFSVFYGSFISFLPSCIRIQPTKLNCRSMRIRIQIRNTSNTYLKRFHSVCTYFSVHTNNWKAPGVSKRFSLTGESPSKETFEEFIEKQTLF